MRFELPIFGFVACGALCVAVWAHRESSGDDRSPVLKSALGAIPPGADLVLLVDVERVRDALPPRLLRFPTLPFAGQEPLAREELGTLCGFSPLDKASELALAVRHGTGGESELFVATAGDFRAEPTIACAEALLKARGGTPARARSGSFMTLGDSRTGAPRGMLALRDGGPILLSEPNGLEAMIETVDHRAASLFDEPHHARLRRELPGHPALVATLLLAPGWPDRWQLPELADTPLARARAASFGLELAAKPTVRALVSCPDPTSCRKLAAWLEDTWARLVELGAKFELALSANLAISAHDDHVALSSPIDLEQLLEGLDGLDVTEPNPP